MKKNSKSTSRKVASTPQVDESRILDYLDVGRVNQKQRTRDSLVNVAVQFIREGKSVSVADVADAARASRTTAYRYFPTSEMLSVQATIVAASSVEGMQLIDNITSGSASPEDKLDAVIVASDAMTRAHEAAYRSLLRHSVEAATKIEKAPPMRRPFRRQWLQAALSAVKSDLGQSRFNRLTAGLSLFCGIESFVVLKDICSLGPDSALEIKRWAAQRLLQAALDDAAKSRSAKSA